MGLSHVAYNPQDTVETVLSTNPLNLSFRRVIDVVKRTEYDDLIAKVTGSTYRIREILSLGGYIGADNL